MHVSHLSVFCAKIVKLSECFQLLCSSQLCCVSVYSLFKLCSAYSSSKSLLLLFFFVWSSILLSWRIALSLLFLCLLPFFTLVSDSLVKSQVSSRWCCLLLQLYEAVFYPPYWTDHFVILFSFSVYFFHLNVVMVLWDFSSVHPAVEQMPAMDGCNNCLFLWCPMFLGSVPFVSLSG